MNQPFINHVRELRRRLMWSALVVGVGATVAYLYHGALLAWLEAPLRETLYYSRVTGAFEFIVQACLTAGVLLAAPMILYQLVAFIRPALARPLHRGAIVAVIAGATVLVASGVAFGYYVSLPAALHFLGSIDTAHLHPLLAADSYLTFVINYLAVYGLVFLLPLLIIFADHIRPLPPAGLARWRKWVVVGAFGAALVLPIAPDPVSQVILAAPIVVMYELAIVAVRFQGWRRRLRAAPSAPAAPPTALGTPARTPRRPLVTHPLRPVSPERLRALGPHIIDLRQG